MKRLLVTLVALVALLFAAPSANAGGWFDVLSMGGETISINTDISTADNGQSFQVWVRNSYDLPETRAEYTRERGYDKTVGYKLTLYKFTDGWKRFNIVQVAVYGEDGIMVDQYANPDMSSTESMVPPGSPIETIAENAKIIYDINTNPE